MIRSTCLGLPLAAALAVCPQFALATITSIDASGAKVTVNRPTATSGGISGVAPLHVFFDATGVTCTSTKTGDDNECSHPDYHPSLHFLNFEWSYGDPGSGTWEIPGSHITGKSKNAATGFLGAHLYERPGQYTARLTLSDGNGGTATRQFTFSVADPNAVYAGAKTACVSAVGNFAGCPTGAAQVTSSDWATVLNARAGAGQRVLFRRGDTFRSSGGFTLRGSGPTTIGAFPSTGAKPILTRTVPGPIWTCAVNATDIRLMDLHFWEPATVHDNKNVVFLCDRYTRNLVMIRTEVEPNRSANVIQGNFRTMARNNDEMPEGFGAYENRWVKIKGIGNGINIIWWTAQKIALLGNEIRDTLVDEPGEGTEHIIRMSQYDRILIADNYMGEEGTGRVILALRNIDITPANDGTGNPCVSSTSSWCGKPSVMAVIEDNHLAPTMMPIRPCDTNKAAVWTVRCEDGLIDRNIIQAPASGMSMNDAIWHSSMLGLSIRNNLIDFTGNAIHGNGYRGPLANTNGSPQGNFVYAYNNTCIWLNKGSHNFRCFRMDGGGTRRIARNNLLFYTGSTGGQIAVEIQATAASNNLVLSSSPFVANAPVSPPQFRLRPGTPADGTGMWIPANMWDFAGPPELHSRPPSIGAWSGAGAVDTTPPASPVLLQ